MRIGRSGIRLARGGGYCRAPYWRLTTRYHGYNTSDNSDEGSWYLIASWNGKSQFIPISWQIYTLDKLLIQVKHEFNASNRELYAKEALLAQGRISEWLKYLVGLPPNRIMQLPRNLALWVIQHGVKTSLRFIQIQLRQTSFTLIQ